MGVVNFPFSLDMLMVKVAFYIDFALIASYFQNNEQKKMLEMWNQNSVFESRYIITMYILWILLFKRCFLAIPSPYDPWRVKNNSTITQNYNFVLSAEMNIT